RAAAAARGRRDRARRAGAGLGARRARPRARGRPIRGPDARGARGTDLVRPQARGLRLRGPPQRRPARARLRAGGHGCGLGRGGGLGGLVETGVREGRGWDDAVLAQPGWGAGIPPGGGVLVGYVPAVGLRVGGGLSVHADRLGGDLGLTGRAPFSPAVLLAL